MEYNLHKYVTEFVLWSTIPLLCLVFIYQFYSLGNILSLCTAYILSLAFVGSNFWNVKNVKIQDHRLFQRKFYQSLAVRAVLVLAAIIIVLLVKEEGKILFIISFMFFYLCLSVIEVLIIKKVLKINRKD